MINKVVEEGVGERRRIDNAPPLSALSETHESSSWMLSAESLSPRHEYRTYACLWMLRFTGQSVLDHFKVRQARRRCDWETARLEASASLSIVAAKTFASKQ